MIINEILNEFRAEHPFSIDYDLAWVKNVAGATGRVSCDQAGKWIKTAVNAKLFKAFAQTKGFRIRGIERAVARLYEGGRPVKCYIITLADREIEGLAENHCPTCGQKT